ncbi:MAG TPA: ATPase, T2SS/T4P/T4SS family [Acidimicrobiia bacterium]|nr:ATPase, T2SS/T4P/T4SS family [Acidimicrobiia bacterium]
MTAVTSASGAPDALEIVEGEVRELVQRREVELDDSIELHVLLDEVVDDYRERFLRGGLPPLTDDDVQLLRHRLAGVGALTPLLDDPEVEEIWVNEPGRVFVARRGEHELTTLVLSARDVEEVVERMLARAGRRLDRSQPFVDARLPDGSRLHVVIPPITNHWALNVRKFVGLRAHTLDELVGLGSCSASAARFLAAAVRAGLNIVVAGAVGAGKTTLLNCLASCIPGRERIVTCEEVFELQPAVPDVVAMQCRQRNLEGEGAVTLHDLVRESLRMRPDRIIVGEVRGAEALDMLLAMNSGAGAMTSVHANSGREALRKLTTLPLLAGDNVDRRFVAQTVAACIDLVVFCRRTGGRREIAEIVAVGDQLGDGDEPTAGPVFTGGGASLRWTGERPRHRERFADRGIDLDEVLT